MSNMMFGMLFAAVLVGAFGIIIGLLLGVAGKAFKVEEDERIGKIRECLPGNNCGGCGYPGCDGLAAAIAAGEAPANQCPGAGDKETAKIAEIMGVENSPSEKKKAFVQCIGTCDKTERKYHYYGNMDCREAVCVPGGGPKACSRGCLGLGSCVKECPFQAIEILNGIAHIYTDRCVGCGKCVAVCPKQVIELVPAGAEVRVGCNSFTRGKATKSVCDVGCIACNACVKVCEAGAITLVNNRPEIDYSKCTNCGKCKEKCRQKVIV